MIEDHELKKGAGKFASIKFGDMEANGQETGT